MYSKEETQRIKKDFWKGFADAYPIKWRLFDTKIKDVALKFYVDNKKAEVMLAIESKDEELRTIYFQKMESLQTLLRKDFLDDVVLDQHYFLPNGKEISKVWVSLEGVSVNDSKTWPAIYTFFYEKMRKLEAFYEEYEDYIKDLQWNT